MNRSAGPVCFKPPQDILAHAAKTLGACKRAALLVPPGIEQALAARRLLLALHAQHPGVEWAVLGPRSSLFVFEMDPAVAAYIPVQALEPRRPAQFRLAHWWQGRQHVRKLAQLPMDAWLGCQATASVYPRAQVAMPPVYRRLFAALGSQQANKPQWWCAAQIDEYATLPGWGPLQLGPNALARATRLFQSMPPNVPKVVVVLGEASEPLGNLRARADQVQGLPGLEGGAWVWLVLAEGAAMRHRRMASQHPEWEFASLADCLGVLVYADRVMCHVPQITRLLSDIGRADRLMLDKTHT
ncbi:MAG TPA: hypothetical protein VFV39_07125 [Limnobacter sp.]|nr:hypothetical protein [Limnobacter sp.]